MAADSLSVKLEGKFLVVRIPVTDGVPSSTGKTLVVATTHGNVDTGIDIKGKRVKLGLNAFVKP